MIPAPRRAGPSIPSPIAPPTPSEWPDIDDDDGWQDMPVVRSDQDELAVEEDVDDDKHKRSYAAPVRPDPMAGPSHGPGHVPSATGASNATGAHLEMDSDTFTLATDSWRQKNEQDESDYTRLRLDEDEESDAVHMRTKYLFNEDKAMTPLSQMQATKEFLTEGQRIAYVGLCHLVAKKMVRDSGRGWQGVIRKTLKGKDKAIPVQEDAGIWMIKIMARLYQHMELEPAEQKMIESLAEHGVDPSDLVPALMATHTIKNPEFDPNAKRQAEMGVIPEIPEDVPPPPYSPASQPVPQEQAAEVPLPPSKSSTPRPPSPAPASAHKPINPFGDDEDELELTPRAPKPIREEVDDGDIGDSLPSPALGKLAIGGDESGDLGGGDIAAAIPGVASPTDLKEDHDRKLPVEGDVKSGEDAKSDEDAEKPDLLPSLPGVSTSLTNLDEHVTLDIRWTVLCDLFLVLIADSVYDARSRTYLQLISEALGFEWLDSVRFENRITDALEIQEAVGRNEQGEVIEGRRKQARNKRYAMMGLAAVGGGLVIGLSAGLLAPVIGAGLGAAFATVGITGTSGFLAGAGGAAVITTTGVVTGANIGGKGMARRTREVRTFEFRPIHNNKRVACYITMGGFMASKMDDVRLPFSVLDPIIGDVISVYWEPEMMEEMGGALKILTSEILTSVGQQVLAATVMAALISALQWPIILTKLGYLIDNPWSNALDRSKAAGLVLADVILQRHAGVRPISLIGFSLGARSIFYALIELSRRKAFGLVQDVFIFGTTVTANRTQWLEARSVVSGRFVNGFATNDWMLGYLFRATSGGLNTVAGLRPVETVPGLENVEVTDIITGHMSYRSMMPLLLERVGLPVTSDHFDEPEDPNIDMTQQERIIVNEEEEEAKRNKSKILGIFSRTTKSRNGSGASTPVDRKSTSADATKRNSYDDDDDLPPREASEGVSGDIGMGMEAPSTDSLAQAKAAAKAEEEAVKHIPKTAGFDFAAISKALGKDIDVDKIKVDDRAPVSALPVDLDRTGIERSTSVPPQVNVSPPADELPRLHLSNGDRSSSYSVPIRTDDDEGDITYGADTGDVWGRRPSPPTASSSSWGKTSTVSSSPVSPAPFSGVGASFDHNAWAAPATSTGSGSGSSAGMRAAPPARPHPPELTGGFAAPPARPHPPELMANPFATAPGSAPLQKKDQGVWGWGRKQKSLEDEAMNNPW